MNNKAIHLYERFIKSAKYSYRKSGEELSKFEAVIDLIYRSKDGVIMDSLAQLSKEWRWGYSKKVKRFLDDLKHEGYLQQDQKGNYIVKGYRSWYGQENIMNYEKLTNHVLDYYISVTKKTKTKISPSKIDDIRKCVERNGKKDPVTLQDFKSVIDLKFSQWHGNPQMEDYIEWSTLFGRKKFNEKYLEEARNARVQQKQVWSKERTPHQ